MTNVTVPDGGPGQPVPGPGVTVAVMVTGWPTAEGSGAETTVVVVG
nr:hypothetical protein [Streptomyces sp. S07_1.15]